LEDVVYLLPYCASASWVPAW